MRLPPCGDLSHSAGSEIKRVFIYAHFAARCILADLFLTHTHTYFAHQLKGDSLEKVIHCGGLCDSDQCVQPTCTSSHYSSSDVNINMQSAKLQEPPP